MEHFRWKTNKSTVTGLHNVIPLQIHYLQEVEESRKAYIFHQGLLGLSLRGHEGIVHQQWEWRTSSFSPGRNAARCTRAERFDLKCKRFTTSTHNIYCAVWPWATGSVKGEQSDGESERNDTEHLNYTQERKVLNSHVPLWKSRGTMSNFNSLT